MTDIFMPAANTATCIFCNEPLAGSTVTSSCKSANNPLPPMTAGMKPHATQVRTFGGTSCTIPPNGWKCSREPGHAGPCAARPGSQSNDYINRTMTEFPYDTYVDKALSKIRFSAELRYVNGTYQEPTDDDWRKCISQRELRSMLADAWLAGLSHNLELIESEKGRRDDKQN